MSVDSLIRLLAILTLVGMMVTIGLEATISQVRNVVNRPRLLLGAFLASYALVPLAALGLLVEFHAAPIVAAGILMAVVCAGAPIGLQFTKMAKGDVPLAIGLMVVLAALSTVVSPILLYLVLPLLPGRQPLRINVVGMVVTLFLSQFLPLCAGLAIREKWGPLAQELEALYRRVSLALVLLLITVILAVQRHRLLSLRATEVLGIFLFVFITFAICWRLGSYIPTQRAMTAATSIRNISAGLVLVTFSFPGTRAVSSAAVYALCQVVVLAFVFMAWGKASPTEEEQANSNATSTRRRRVA
jgi:BASS family bile acid:Na+ symporter